MAKPMRVLQIVTQMNRGGMENRLMDIYRALDREALQFDFYTLRAASGQFDAEIQSLGGHVYHGAPLRAKNLSQIPAQFAAFFAEHPEYRVAHAHLNQWCGLVLQGAKRAHVPVRVAHARTALAGGGFENGVKNVIKHLYEKAPTHRFAVSEKAGVWLYGRRAFARGEVEVYPNAIETERFLYNAALRERTRAALSLSEAFCLLHVGNFRAVKNHEFLFSIFEQVLQSDSGAVLLLAGEGERAEALRALAQQKGFLERVRFLGSRDDVPALLCAADAFVFPSLYEGLPGAVLEAQAASLPCFISDTIAREVVLSPLCTPLSLSAPASAWAKQILASQNHARKNEFALFDASGFDIHSLVKRLSSFYLSAAK